MIKIIYLGQRRVSTPRNLLHFRTKIISSDPRPSISVEKGNAAKSSPPQDEPAFRARSGEIFQRRDVRSHCPCDARTCKTSRWCCDRSNPYGTCVLGKITRVCKSEVLPGKTHLSSAIRVCVASWLTWSINICTDLYFQRILTHWSQQSRRFLLPLLSTDLH